MRGIVRLRQEEALAAAWAFKLAWKRCLSTGLWWLSQLTEKLLISPYPFIRVLLRLCSLLGSLPPGSCGKSRVSALLASISPLSRKSPGLEFSALCEFTFPAPALGPCSKWSFQVQPSPELRAYFPACCVIRQVSASFNSSVFLSAK